MSGKPCSPNLKKHLDHLSTPSHGEMDYEEKVNSLPNNFPKRLKKLFLSSIDSLKEINPDEVRDINFPETPEEQNALYEDSSQLSKEEKEMRVHAQLITYLNIFDYFYKHAKDDQKENLRKLLQCEWEKL